MNVLLTGASGFIGSGALEYFLEHTDWTFTCICSWRHQGNPLNIQPDERVTVITHDLTGPIPEIGTFDYIIHMASESHVDRSISDPVGFIENNVSSTLQTLEYARTHPPKVFLHFSTDEVYGATDHSGWDVLLPSNPYAASKAAQEMIVLSYWRTYGVPIVITNSNNVIGPNQHSEKYIPKLIRLIRAEEPVTIHVSNGKPGKRYYNSVRNVADALLFILARAPRLYEVEKTDRPDRYSLAGGQELDNLEMAQLIAELMGVEMQYELVDVETIRPGYDQFYPKTDGVLSELGWIPPFDLTSELLRIIQGQS